MAGSFSVDVLSNRHYRGLGTRRRGFLPPAGSNLEPTGMRELKFLIPVDENGRRLESQSVLITASSAKVR